MTYTTAVLVAFAQHLADGNFGEYLGLDPAPTAVYAPGARAIVVGVLPEAPDAAIGLLPYYPGGEPDPTYRQDVTSEETNLQLRVRMPRGGTVLDAVAFHDGLRDALHRRDLVLPVTGGPLRLRSREVSTAMLGPDTNNRWVFTQNFALRGLRARA